VKNRSLLSEANPSRVFFTDQQHNNAFGFPPNQQVGVDPNHDLSYGDQSARRKRSKVSRACDECRRKKVRELILSRRRRRRRRRRRINVRKLT
jgi:hypothetical protein